jgi:hypothetical protein
LHGLGDHVADRRLAVGRDGADLGDLVGALHLLRLLLDLIDDVDHGLVDAALEVHRVHAGGDGLQAFAYDRLRQHGRRRGAVAGGVVGLGGNLAQHLRAHILELVLELDLLGHGHAVLGRARRAERLLEDHVAAFGPKRDLHRIGQDIDAAHHALAGLGRKLHIFRCHFTRSDSLLDFAGVGVSREFP